MFRSICPIFPSMDFALTRAFYEPLGFQLHYGDESYLIFQRGAVELHFFQANSSNPAVSAHSAFVRVLNARALSAEFQTLDYPREGVPRVTEAEDKPWGICELAIVDPDGNLLRVGHLLND